MERSSYLFKVYQRTLYFATIRLGQISFSFLHETLNSDITSDNIVQICTKYKFLMLLTIESREYAL